MREPDEAAGMILFGLVHAVVDQAAGSKVWLIEARAAGEHRNVDARLVHHPNMRRKIGEQRIEPIIWISVFVEAEATIALAGLHQLGWCIMMLKINKHFTCSEGMALESSSSSARASTSDIRQKAPQGL
jgi:hypothetical protein